MPMFSRRMFHRLLAFGLPAAVAARAAGQTAAYPLNADRGFQGGALSTPPQGLLGAPAAAPAASTSPWAKQLGLELYTVRDRMATDLEGTLATVAALGYKEVEPTDYGGLSAKAYRALLDKNGLSAPSTHATAVMGPDFEKTLEGMQIVGHKYITVAGAASLFAPATVFGPTPPGAAAQAAKAMAALAAKPGGILAAVFPPATADSTKQVVDSYNQAGAIAKKYGMQVLVHNHAIEFQRFPGSDQCPYDIIVGESDPELVVMQMDIGWTCIAGENPLDWWTRYPGRFPLWHVKDCMGLNYFFPQPEQTEMERMNVASNWLAPVGLGMINYGELFQHAATAGLKHYCVEQDNAAAWGDSPAAAGVSARNLVRALG